MSAARRNGPADGGTAAPLRPLIEEGGAAADALVAANERAEPLLGEETRAWAALASRRGKRRRWTWSSAVAGAAAMAVLVAVAWWLVPRQPSPGDRKGVAPAAQAPARTPATSVPPLPRQAPAAPLQQAPSALRAGESALTNGVRVRLSDGGHGDVVAAGEGRTTIALARGTLEIDARPAPDRGESPGAIRVTAASFSIEGRDAHFTVTARRVGSEVSVTVAVHDGKAGISSGTLAPIWVYAGDLWISPATSGKRARSPQPRPIPAESPADGERAAAAAPDCLRLAGAGANDAALSCFEAQSRQPGLAGELALVELARLRRDLKGDIAGAERALAEYGRRFPRGSLVAEAGIARIELLLQLGRASEALAQAERLATGEASFWRGVCLAKLGRHDEARQALDDYLAHPGGTRRAEAMRRRQELGR
jgi:hypothetical protein